MGIFEFPTSKQSDNNVRNIFMHLLNYIWRPDVAQEHKHVSVNVIGCGFDSHLGKLNIQYFHFLCLVSK